MGRILRFTMGEDVPMAIDLGMVTPGKLLIKCIGGDLRIGYDKTDVASASGVSYYTLFDTTDYVFDIGPGVGVLANRQNLWVNCTTAAAVIEVWVANEQ